MSHVIPKDIWFYRAVVVRVIDGDTIDVDIDLGFNMWALNQRIRLKGIDAPETRTRDLEEKAEGLRSKARVEELCPVGSSVFLTTEFFPERGKYGRIIADVYLDETDQTLTDILVEEGLAEREVY